MVWTVYTVMAISVISMFYFLQQFEDVQPKWDWLRLTFTAMCCINGFVCNYKPKIISNRILFICCLFGSMIYVITVMSFMLYVIEKSIFENQMKTIKEIVDNSYDFVGDGYALEHLMGQKEVINKFIHKSYLENPKLAVAISREHAHNNRLNSDRTFYCFESEIIYEYSLEF